VIARRLSGEFEFAGSATGIGTEGVDRVDFLERDSQGGAHIQSGDDFVFKGGETLDVEVEEVENGAFRLVGNVTAHGCRALQRKGAGGQGFLDLLKPVRFFCADEQVASLKKGIE